MSKRNSLLFLSMLFSLPAVAQTWITGYYVDSSLAMSDIPWSKMTHVIHFKSYPDGSGGLAGITAANASQFTAAAHAAGVKALLCVGDNNNNFGAYSTATSTYLNTFVSNVVNFVNANNYDGVDLDWETSKYSPGTADGTNYINFINALRAALGPNKSIAIAVYWANGLENVVQSTISALNQVNIMCYDMDQWITWTYHNDATYRPSGDTSNCSCAAEAVQFATYIPAAKIGLGIPFYGRVWSGCADAACSDGLHSPGQAWSGKASQSTIFYRDLIKSSYWASPQVWDSVRGATYISIDQAGAANDRFITFTSQQQINDVVKFGKAQGYGGYMLFEVEYDFVSTAAGDARHPLASAAYTAVTGSTGTAPAAAPIVSGGSPTGTLAAGTTQATLAVTTNVSATCKYATATGTAYASMPYTFQTTGGTAHSTPLSGLTSGTSYNYYVRCADAAGNADTGDYVVSFSVAAAATAPPPASAPPPAPTASGVTISPNSGSGSSQTFTLQATTANGYASLTQVDTVFGEISAGSCWVEYDPVHGKLYLKSDNNLTWASAAIGSGGALSNSQCAVNTAASSASGSGNTLTVALVMTFTPAYAGLKNIYGFTADSAGYSSGWQTIGSWTVSTSAPAAPSVTAAISPNSGSGTTQTFTLQVTDSNGAGNLVQADLLIGASVGATGSCYVEYQPRIGTVFLSSDDNATWTQGTPGSSTVLQNSQCSINLAASSAGVSGNTLSLALAISFKPAFAGAKNLFAFGAEAGANSGWQTAGTWTVTVPVGLSVSVSPNAGSGRSQIFTAQVTDSNGANTLRQVDLYFGANLGAAANCYVEYGPATGTLYLNTGSGWAQAKLGSAATLSNSFCSVNAATATVSSAGAILAVQIPITFTSNFLGTKTIYTFAADSAGLSTRWQKGGTYTVR